jgi:dihydrofolate reductase
MELALIAAVARDGAIGQANGLLFRLPEDLQHFKRTTLGCPVVMGRKTWDSLPAAFRPLPGRRNLVVTRQPALHAPLEAAGAESAGSLDDALARLADAPRVFVIGGGELYAQALPHADALELTEIEADAPQADAFFPAWDRGAFREVTRETRESAQGLRFHWVRYERLTAG